MLSRRWALFALTVVVLAYGCWWLGRWQFHRLHDREQTNSQVRSNLSAADAYQICSLAVDFHVTQTVNGEKGVHGLLRKGLLF